MRTIGTGCTGFVADRMSGVPRSFIREILKTTLDPEIISFAGGLPNPSFFPVSEIKDATMKVLDEDGENALQYSTTEGYYPLRKFISDRYVEKKGIYISPDDIIITNGSQQAIALACKTFLNPRENVIVEEPGYLGAIQAISFYQPHFQGIRLRDNGIDTDMLERELAAIGGAKMYYFVPNFQNPSGITYTEAVRARVAEIFRNYDTLLVEDDPYAELSFSGTILPPMASYPGINVLSVGSFSKIISPALRLGWVAASRELIDKLTVSKQASDLHSNYLSQRIAHRFLTDNDVESHIKRIREHYKAQKNAMVEAMKKYFPEEVRFTNPDGGMFLWVSLPNNISAYDLFNDAIKEKVAFVPGSAFYTDESKGGYNEMRLNFTNSSEERIEEGIKRLGKIIKKKITEKFSGVVSDEEVAV